jgi:hypothetical protein
VKSPPKRQKRSEGLEMGGRFKGSSLHHRRSTLRYLDGFAAAILLTGRRLVYLGLKAKK